MEDRLRKIAMSIIEREEERRRRGEELRSSMEWLIKRVKAENFNGSIGAVDSGFVHDEYGSLILLLIRSVGAVFSYGDGRLESVDYVPSPLPDVEIVDNDQPIEREDYHPFISLHRLSSELQRALQVLERGPRFFFLDGSVVPQIADKPRSRDSPLYPLYLRVVALFREVYSYYPDTVIGGIVKDSRGNRLGLYLRGESIDVPNWQDVSWLSYVLRPGEYTAPIPYSEEPKKHATLKNLGDDAYNVYLFYIRTSPWDRPFRVEIYSKKPELDAEKVATLLYSLSSVNPYYSIPPFMVEVDMRARLGKESLSYVKAYLERMIVGRFPVVRLFDRRPY